MMVLGTLYNGLNASDYYRPSFLDFSATVDSPDAKSGKDRAVPKWGDSPPIPAGVRLLRRDMDGAPLMAISETHALRFRRIY